MFCFCHLLLGKEASLGSVRQNRKCSGKLLQNKQTIFKFAVVPASKKTGKI